jgi:hypothetical protein
VSRQTSSEYQPGDVSFIGLAHELCVENLRKIGVLQGKKFALYFTKMKGVYEFDRGGSSEFSAGESCLRFLYSSNNKNQKVWPMAVLENAVIC